MAKPPSFHIRLRDGVCFDSKQDYAAACGYSLSYIAALRRKGLGWQAIWNRKRRGTPGQIARRKRRISRSRPELSLFEPVPE